MLQKDDIHKNVVTVASGHSVRLGTGGPGVNPQVRLKMQPEGGDSISVLGVLVHQPE